MKKTIIILCTILSILMILDTIDAGKAIGMFFLVGAIPGTDLRISASSLLVAYALIGGFTLSRLANAPIRFAVKNKQLA